MSKNLTTLIKHPVLRKDVAGYVSHSKSEWGQHLVTRCPGDGYEYLTGPVVDRLHEFESVGLEPEEIKSLMAAHSDLLKKYTPKKVDVSITFKAGDGIEVRTSKRYHFVREIRCYRCPTCLTILTERSKTTKLYTDRTVVDMGDFDTSAWHSNAKTCYSCSQPLVWGDICEEESK